MSLIIDTVHSEDSVTVGGVEAALRKQNVVYVQKNPGPGQFSSLAAACDSILDSSELNPYKIEIGPGLYIEPLVNIPAYTFVTGSALEATVIEADALDHHVITAGEVCEVSFLTISGAGTGYAGFACLDNGNYGQMHKVSLRNNDIHVLVTSSTKDTFCYLEYVDINGDYSYGLKIESSNGFLATCNAENFYSYPSSSLGTEVFVSGPTAECELEVFTLKGVLGSGVVVDNGAKLECRSGHFDNLSLAVADTVTGSVSDIKISGCIFSNNTKNIDIVNSGTSGYVSGGYLPWGSYSILDSSTFFVTEKDPHYITVGKTGFDFISIADACDAVALLTPSSTNRFKIRIFPGVYTERVINLPAYTTLFGESINDVVIKPNANNHNLINMSEKSAVAFVTLSDVGTGYSAISCLNTSEASIAHKVLFVDCDTGVLLSSSTLDSDLNLEYCTFNGSFKRAVEVASSNSKTAHLFAQNISSEPSVCTDSQFLVTGTKAHLDLHLAEIAGTTFDTAIRVVDGATLHTTGVDCFANLISLDVPNIGAAPTLKADITTESCAGGNDILIDHPGALGAIRGVADRSKVTVNISSPLSLTYTNYASGGITILKDIYQGSSHETLLDFSKLVREGAMMGAVSGGELSLGSGRTVNIAAGVGFVIDTVGNYVKQLTWSANSVTLPADAEHSIYISEAGIPTSATTRPSPSNAIILGRAKADSTNIVFVTDAPVVMKQFGVNIEDMIRNSLGSIFTSGCIVSENVTTARQINVTSGSFYYGTALITPSGGTPISFATYYKNGSGGYVYTPSQSTVDNTKYDDGSGTLATMTTGYFAKHTLYVVGEGALEEYFFIYSQTQYANQILAEEGNIPTPPSWIRRSVALLATIIIENGATHFAKVTDERPRIGFKPSSVSSVTSHGDLTDLADDDHTQYLLANGTRAMSGVLNMGTNAITNVGLVDGVDVSNHASRHQPNSATDPLLCAAAVSVAAVNAEGGSNYLARADHTHAGVSTYKVDGGTARVGSINLISGFGANIVDDGAGNVTFNTIVATAQLVTTIGTGLNINYTAGNVSINGVYTAISAGFITVNPSSSNFWIYVNPTSYAVSFGSTLPANSVPMAQYSSNVSVVTALNDRRTYTNTNDVFGTPITSLSATTTNESGSANSDSRSDHSHALLTGVVSSQVPDQTAATGSSANLARADHIHNIPTGVPSSIGSANAQGTSVTAFVKQDHVHQGIHSLKVNAGSQRFGDIALLNGTGITIIDDGAGNFSFTTAGANSQLNTSISSGLIVAYTAGNVLINGTYTSIIAGNTTVGANVTNGWIYVTTGGVVANGASLPSGAIALAQFTSGASTISALNDRRTYINQNIVYGSAVTIGTANSAGSSDSISRADHVHDHGSQTTGSHHAVVTTSVNGFMSATDKTKLNALVMKTGRVAFGTFAGSPKKATVTFTTPFASTSYNISLTGTDDRTFTYESKLAGSFVINTNSNQALTGEVSWQAILDGEVG
jgi:hypothetical protein